MKVNIKYFSGAKINYVDSKLDKLLESKPEFVNMTSNQTINELLILKHCIEKTLPSSKVVIYP